MKHTVLSSIAIIAVLLLPFPSHAGMFEGFNFSGTFESVYWSHDPDDWTEDVDPLYDGPYTSLENNLSLLVDWKKWFAEIRLRSMIYDDPIHYDPRTREHETDLEIFKATAGYRHNRFTITAGDFYKSIAHGIAMYVQEDKELNIDRTLRGGMLEVPTAHLDITVFGGDIRWYKFRDEIREKIFDEFKIEDRIVGGRLLGKLPFGIDVGATYTRARIYEVIRDELESEDVTVSGGDLAIRGLLSGRLDFYTEYARLNWDEDEPFGNNVEDGEAIYASITAYTGGFTILTEYKDYDYWEYRYTRPPTADRDDEEADIYDIRGFRLKIDYFLPSTNTLIYISGGRFDNHAHESSYQIVTRNRIDHIYGGIEQTWDKLYVHLTYGNKEYKTLNETHRHGTGDFVYNITTRHSLNLFYEYKYTGNEDRDAGQIIAEKDEHKSYLTYSVSPWFALSIHYNKHVIAQRNRPDEKDNWVACEAVVTPISALSLSLMYGELPPGLICSGGQCRIVPAFEGIQAMLTYRF
ncbi:hypothetical protein JXA40_00575 [bacterium]|nr:hypothetical protein [candidate division CSSED10-310 bacterium]